MCLKFEFGARGALIITITKKKKHLKNTDFGGQNVHCAKFR